MVLGKVCPRADSYKLLSECYYLPDNVLIQKIIDIAKTDQFFIELVGCIPPAVELESLRIKDAPDHIAMELEFMYYLVARQNQAVNEENLQNIQLNQQKQKTFLYSHLARWVPEFAENAQKYAQTEFYKKLAQLTEMFVLKDSDTCASFDAR